MKHLSYQHAKSRIYIERQVSDGNLQTGEVSRPLICVSCEDRRMHAVKHYLRLTHFCVAMHPHRWEVATGALFMSGTISYIGFYNAQLIMP